MAAGSPPHPSGARASRASSSCLESARCSGAGRRSSRAARSSASRSGARLGGGPALLGGGERRRVGMGRALLRSPQLLLMDEPLAALDEARKSEILPYIERLRDENQVPIVYVSHSVSEVTRLAATVV